MKIKSILNSIIEEVNNETDVNKIKEAFTNRVQNSNIKEEDKRKMLSGIKTKSTLLDITKYVYNCLLKYEGCGVIR